MEDIREDGRADRSKTPKQQLSKAMEHIRYAVTIPEPEHTTASPPAAELTETEAGAEDVHGTSAYGVPATFQPKRVAPTEASKHNEQKRSDPFQFGSRYLEEGDDIFAYNAWDHVETDDAYKAFIEQQSEFQRSSPVSDFDKKRFNDKPEKWWDKFYSNNRANFFKDRKWLVQEFPVLGEITKEGYGASKLLEIGAGAGNTAFPLLAMNKNKQLTIHACDYSKKAIDVIRSQEAYDGQVLRADVWDAAGEGDNALPPGIEPGTVDIVVMIFIFSALAPRQWAQAVRNVWDVLKPGGIVLFRDYGRGDLAQVRFKKGRYLEENFYIRGDGTRVYFFEDEELRDIWTGKLPANAFASDKPSTESTDAGANGDAESDAAAEKLRDLQVSDQPAGESVKTPVFDVLNLGVDRRMLVNRQRKLKMYRCWMQARFQKPGTDASVASDH